MRRLILLSLFCLPLFHSSAQIFQSGNDLKNPLYWQARKPDAAYWQQDVHYSIKAKLDETDNRIDGEETLVYTNNSPDTLREVFFHLYQNAFIKGSYLHKLEEEKGQKPKLGKHEAAGEGTQVSEVKSAVLAGDGHSVVMARAAKIELDNTILKVSLGEPLPPGRQCTIQMNFKTWYDNGSTRRRMQMYDAWGFKHYNGCQWYPKICVYDRKFGWETYQHLNKEFYGDFGTFDVSLDFPKNYVVEATGTLQNREEALPAALREQLDVKNFASKKWNEAPSTIIPYVKGERKEWKYHAEGVHDFAFTADPSYRISSTMWNGIECVGIVQEPHASGWQKTPQYIARILETFSRDIGPYGYPKMVAADANDGMEYPMLTLDGGSEPGNHGLLVHEIGHNWFYGMVGSNETYRAALDEGFTQFLTAWGLIKLDGPTTDLAAAKPRWTHKKAEPVNVMDRNVLNSYTIDALRGDELALATHSNDFHDALGHEGGYRQVYYKTASMLYNLQYVLGDSLFKSALQHYFAQWRFAHPYFEDFRASIIQYTHVDLNWFFDEWIETTKTIDYSIEGAHKVKGKPDEWAIKFRRTGQSQMPVDFTVTARNGAKQTFTIPNTWFAKDGTGTLGKWWGWSKIQPEYTAHVTVPGGLRAVQIDTSYRLADADWSNNYYTRGLFSKGGNITRFDWGLPRPVDRRHYRVWLRPDLWWNEIDGIKAGIHFEGDYLHTLHQMDGSIWMNTHLLQSGAARPGGEGFDRYSPINLTLNLASPFNNRSPKLMLDGHIRYLDGLTYLNAGFAYSFSASGNAGLHLQGMYRRRVQDLDYLLLPEEWSSTEERPNTSVNLTYNKAYNYSRGSGSIAWLLRAPFAVGNGANAFNYSFLQLEAVNTHRVGKLDLRTRFFGRIGTGSQLPYESLLFAGGANPEGMMENKYTRTASFVPDFEDWRGISAYEPTHFQQGGGLNLRGYNGYLIRDERDGETLTSYKSRSGAAINAELDLTRLVKFSPKATRNWLHLDAYLFGDVGIAELSHFYAISTATIYPTTMWSDVRADAGAGIAATIKKWGPFDAARPLTIRVDFPVFLNRPPFANPEYAALRYVVGIGRAF